IWITVQQHDWQGINRTAVLISNVQNRGSNLGQMSQALPPWPAFNEIAPQRYDAFVMSATGLGCVETLRQGARIVALAPGRSPLTRRPAGRTVQFFAYILIAARSGLTPMMFMTRVRL